MTDTLHLVLSCTNRKRLPPPASLRFRDLGGSIDERAATWIARVGVEPTSVHARDLYAGEYWQVGLDLAALAAAKFDTRTWVLSAGLGMISADDTVCSYAATLSPGHPDSVAGKGSDGSAQRVGRRWWAALSEWPGPGGRKGPRRIAALAERDPGARVIVCVGPAYLDAITPDLIAASGSLQSPGQLTIFSSAQPSLHLEKSWVHVPGLLRTRLGGSMSSTGLRAASEVVKAARRPVPPGVDGARRIVETLAAAAQPLPKHDRKRLGDSEVRSWIAAEGRRAPGLTKTVALRAFRDAGMACEQERFGRLFAAVLKAGR